MNNDTTLPCLVLGLGNDIAGDDAVGLQVVREYSRRVAKGSAPHAETALSSESYLSVLNHIFDYGKVVVVDAVQVGEDDVGRVFRYGLDDAPAQTSRLAHQCGLATILALARRAMKAQGAEVLVVGIGVPALDHVQLAEGLGKQVTAAIEPAIAAVAGMVGGAGEVSSGDGAGSTREVGEVAIWATVST